MRLDPRPAITREQITFYALLLCRAISPEELRFHQKNVTEIRRMLLEAP